MTYMTDAGGSRAECKCTPKAVKDSGMSKTLVASFKGDQYVAERDADSGELRIFLLSDEPLGGIIVSGGTVTDALAESARRKMASNEPRSTAETLAFIKSNADKMQKYVARLNVSRERKLQTNV